MSRPEQSHVIVGRKQDHIRLCVDGQAEFRQKGTLLEEVQFIHSSLPERSVDDLDLTTQFLGRTLPAPVVVSGMTGGTEEARAINRDIARAASQLGLAFGLGSQRAMVLRPETTHTYQVRDVAPDILLFGNIGVVQAREMSDDAIRRMVDAVQADALCVHLNPAMELIQPQGDRDFSGCLKAIERLAETSRVPIIAKETGCGLSRQAARALREAGVRAVDVSGAGGTSWVGVEARRVEGLMQELGQELWDWGIPTAASVAWCVELGLEVVATGGLRTGTHVAQALALGARAGGLAAPVLRAQQAGGYEGVLAYLTGVVEVVGAITLLTGVGSVAALRRAPCVLGPRLKAWLAPDEEHRARGTA